jgi:sulfide:quinone oxidoreductase
MRLADREARGAPGGPQIWQYLEDLFEKRGITVHLEVELVRLDGKTLYFNDGTTLPYDLCILVPPYRGIKALENSGLTNERGFVPMDWNTMRADQSIHRNIYAIGDLHRQSLSQTKSPGLDAGDGRGRACRLEDQPGGPVRAYLPEFRCVMDQGGGKGLYLYSQYMSDGDVLEIELGAEPYASKIRFEELFMEKRGDIGELHHQMRK